mgnify:CR=1 FL=1
MSLPFVSVIIPVFNNSEQLKICLAALEKQTYPHSLYEVIVIDNDSDEPVEPIVTLFKQAKVIYEKQPGSYAARNKGISIAKGEVIAFTDSDCIPCNEWIEKGVEAILKTPNCGLVAGKINLFFRESKHPTAVELYESITALKQEKLLEVFHAGATANLFTFKEILEKVGKFNEILKSHGDIEWGQRVFLKQYRQQYSIEAIVNHPARNSMRQIYQRTVRTTGGNYLLKSKRDEFYFFRDLIRDILPPLRFTLIVFRDYS